MNNFKQALMVKPGYSLRNDQAQDGIYIVQHLETLSQKDPFKSSITVGEYQPPNWYTPKGTFLKAKALESRDWPNLERWRFVTLTVDPQDWSCPSSAYSHISANFRFFLRKLRRAYPHEKSVWKLEFQLNGWPHWHLLIDYKKFIDPEILRRLWNYGHVQAKSADHNAKNYLLKYLTKDGLLPDWVLHYPRQIRFFQTSPKFFSKTSTTTKCTNKAEPKSQNFLTIQQRLNFWNKSMTYSCGTWKRVLRMNTPWNSYYSDTVRSACSDSLPLEICPHGSKLTFRVTDTSAFERISKNLI